PAPACVCRQRVRSDGTVHRHLVPLAFPGQGAGKRRPLFRVAGEGDGTRPGLAPPEVEQDRRERSRLSQPLADREESYSSAARQEKGNCCSGRAEGLGYARSTPRRASLCFAAVGRTALRTRGSPNRG